MEELQKNTEPEDSKEELNTSEGIATGAVKDGEEAVVLHKTFHLLCGGDGCCDCNQSLFSCSEGKPSAW